MRLEVDDLESSVVELELELAINRVLYSFYANASQKVCLGWP